MHRLGYAVVTWFLRASDHGASLVQDRAVTIFHRGESTPGSPS